MAKLEILNPLAESVMTQSPLAPRLTDLNNKRVGLYWNGKGGGDIALRTIGEQLEKRFAGTKWEIIYASLHGEKDKVEAAKGFDAVVGTTAD